MSRIQGKSYPGSSHTGSSHLQPSLPCLQVKAVMFEAEASGALPPQPKKTRSLLWLALSVAVLAAVGIVGFSLRPRVYSVHHLQHVQDKIMSLASRVLDGDEEVTVSLWSMLREEGADKPSGMKVAAKLQQEMTAEASRPAWIVKFAAKAGKGPELLRQFKNVKRGAIEFEQSMNGEEAGSMLEDAFTIEEGGTDEVVIKAEVPATEKQEEMDGEMADAINSISPMFDFVVKTGRTVGEMFEHLDDPLPLLPGGIEVQVGAVVSSAIGDVVAEVTGPGPEVLALKTLSKIYAHQETTYKRDSAEYWGYFPSLSDEERKVKYMIRHLPASIRDALSGLDEFANGVKTLRFVGLPHRFMIDFTFHNFHIAPVLKALMEAVDQ